MRLLKNLRSFGGGGNLSSFRDFTLADVFHPACQSKRFAFTLAEVLITLGIIGVIAALTMPSLIQNYKKQEASARLKKFVSTMNQAIILSSVQNGDINSWYRNYEDLTSEDKFVNNAQSAYDFFMKYLAPYMKYVSIDKAEPVENPEDMKKYEVRVVFADSSMADLHNGSCLDIRYDYNGISGPNVYGRDKYVFLLCDREYFRLAYSKNKNAIFTSYLRAQTPTRTKAIEMCKTSSFYCTNLLEFDNWEFKDDYPHKL